MPIEGAFKERLMGALHTAVGHFNGGLSPNESVIKSAGEHDFNVDQVSRLAETFNTARTIYHYKNASDRTSSFELADPAAIIPAMFKPEPDVKQSTCVNHDYSSYEVPEVDYHDGINVKAASAVNDVELPTPVDHLDTNMETQTKRAFEAMRVQRDLANTARDEARIAGTKAASLITKVSADLTLGFEDICQDRYNRLTAGYHTQASPNMKDQWAPVMSKLAAFVPMWLDEASKGIDMGPVVDDRDLGDYTNILKEAKYWMEAEAEMLAVAGQLDKEADTFERDWLDVISAVLPKKEASTLADFIDNSIRKIAATDTVETQEYTKEPSYFTKNVLGRSEPIKGTKTRTTENLFGSMSEGINSMIGESTKPIVSSGIQSLVDRSVGPSEQENQDLSARLKNVQRQIMLEDLITNDPVLSEESPDTVAQAYATVLNIAPELASNKEIVRAILRQSVHAVAIDPYTAKDWTELEKNIRSIAGKTSAGAKPVGAKYEDS